MASATTTTGKTTTTTPAPGGKSTTTTKAATPKPKSNTTPAPSGKSTAGRSSGSSSSAPSGGGGPTSSTTVGSVGSGTAINPVSLPADAPGSFAWTDYAVKVGAEIGVPPEIILSLIQAESGGNQYIVGDSGASVGLFQLHERGVGYGLTVEERYDPETQFRLMAPRIQAAYQQGVALGLTGRDLAMYTGYYAEKPAAGSEANYAYAYDVVTGYLAGNIQIGGAPTNLPSGGTPAAPWSSYARGGSRGSPLVGGGTLPAGGYASSSSGSGVVEGLYNNGPTTFSSQYGSSGSTGSGVVGGIVSGVGSTLGISQAVGSIASGILTLFQGAAFQQSRVDSGETVELFGTPLGPLAIPRETLFGGGFVLVGLILLAGGAYLVSKEFGKDSRD